MSTMTECYVAFLDLMGVRSLAAATSQDASRAGLVISALKEAKNTAGFRSDARDVETGEQRAWSLQVQAFSDCVVLFIPVDSKMLSWLFATIRRLHDRLLRLNIPLRGSITIGDMHWEADWSERGKSAKSEDTQPTSIAFGPGLVQAYDLENSAAVYPRILLSEGLRSHLNVSDVIQKAFPLGPGKLTDYCRQDFDGLYHLDVLHPAIDRKDVIGTRQITKNGKKGSAYDLDRTEYPDWMLQVRQFIIRNKASAKGEKLEAKYMWLAHYFNEKAQEASGVAQIDWFEDVVPLGAVKATIQTSSGSA